MVEELIQRSEKLVYIKAVILVERESQKPIVIGKNGQILKKIGETARKEIEALLEKKVYLELHVKVEKNWQENPFSYLKSVLEIMKEAKTIETIDINFIKIFNDGPAVSLKGSPTVSPTTLAL